MRRLFCCFAAVARAAAPPGPGPFRDSVVLPQPVRGARRAATPDGWRAGRLCVVTSANNSNATAALQNAIDDCGDRAEGGTVLVPSNLTLRTASLWLRSNLTLRVEGALVGTASGYGDYADPSNTNITDAPNVYTRRESVMRWAHAGLLNAGRCVKMKDPLVGWDDCAEWSTLENVAVEGGGLLDANARGWFEALGEEFNAEPVDGFANDDGRDSNARPMMLDLLWVRGLTIRDVKIRRPGYWTVHPTFCDDVVVSNNSIVTTGANTDGLDPDSCWNVYVAENSFSTGDDCIAIKAGRDWSGRMVDRPSGIERRPSRRVAATASRERRVVPALLRPSRRVAATPRPRHGCSVGRRHQHADAAKIIEDGVRLSEFGRARR